MNAPIPNLYTNAVAAGFPSPADDYIEQPLDLNTHLVRNPVASFFVKVSGDSMKNAGIHTDDMLIVDRSLTPKNRDIVVAIHDGEFTVKTLEYRKNSVKLVPANESYPEIEVTPETIIWGVVCHVVRTLR